MAKKKRKKDKKEKIVYYDDNSTVSDMDPVEAARHRDGYTPPQKKHPTAREKFRTYWEAVKMMFFPMLIVLAVLAIIYLIVTLVM